MVHGHLLFSIYYNVPLRFWGMYICLRKDKVIYYLHRAYLCKRLAFALWPFMPWCLHSIFHIKIKLHLTYSALSRSKILPIILTSPQSPIIHHHVFRFTKSFSYCIPAFQHHPTLSINLLQISTWVNLILASISPFWPNPTIFYDFTHVMASFHHFGHARQVSGHSESNRANYGPWSLLVHSLYF